MSKVDDSVPGVGLSTFMASGSDGSTPLDATKQAVASGSGRIYGYWFTNSDSTQGNFIHFYDAVSSNVTVGTTAPLFTLSPAAGISGNLSIPYGIQFRQGLTVSATNSAGGNTNPATAVDLVIWYALSNLL